MGNVYPSWRSFAAGECSTVGDRRRGESTIFIQRCNEVESPMSHKILTGLGTAAGGFVAAGLISLAAGPVAHACSAEDPPTLCDPNLLSSPLLDIGGYTNQSFADPGD